MIDEMMDYVKKTYPMIRWKMIETENLFFEERVKINCFYCGRYNNNWKCPLRIPDIDYKKMINEYCNKAFIYVEMPIDESNYEAVRKESSVYLHRAMLLCEKWLYQNNEPMALSFIGGACKLCKNGCMPERCANPYASRSPLEALGVNVMKSAASAGIEVKFPTTEYMMRIGLLLW